MSTLKKLKALRKGNDLVYNPEDCVAPSSLQYPLNTLASYTPEDEEPVNPPHTVLEDFIAEFTATKLAALEEHKQTQLSLSKSRALKSPTSNNNSSGSSGSSGNSLTSPNSAKKMSRKHEELLDKYITEIQNNPEAGVESLLLRNTSSINSKLLSIQSTSFHSENERKSKFGHSTDVNPNDPNASLLERSQRVGSGRFVRNRLAVSLMNAHNKRQKAQILVPDLPDEYKVPVLHNLFTVIPSICDTIQVGNTSLQYTTNMGIVRLKCTRYCQDLFNQYYSIKATHDIQHLVYFVQQHPGFVPAVLHLTYILEYLNQQQDALILMKRALSCFEVNLTKRYVLGLIQGKLQLSVSQDPTYTSLVDTSIYSSVDYGPELASCFIKLLSRYALFLSRKSLHKTALSLQQLAFNCVQSIVPDNKLLVMEDVELTSSGPIIPKVDLLSARPSSYTNIQYLDPSCTRSLLDYYYLRAAQYTKMLQVYFTWSAFEDVPAAHIQVLEQTIYSKLTLPYTQEEANMLGTPKPKPIHTITNIPEPNLSPLGAKVVPLTVTNAPLRYLLNWCFSSVLAAYNVYLTTNEYKHTNSIPLVQNVAITDILNYGGIQFDNLGNVLPTSYGTLPSITLQRAILLYADVFVKLMEDIDCRALQSNSQWIEVYTMLQQHVKDMYGSDHTNKLLDRHAHVYIKRQQTLWKLLSNNQSGVFIPFLVNNVQSVVDIITKYKSDPVNVLENIATLRSTVYNEKWLSYHSNMSINSIEPSEFSEEVASLPPELLTQQNQAPPPQPRAPRPDLPSTGRGVTRITPPQATGVTRITPQPQLQPQPQPSQGTGVTRITSTVTRNSTNTATVAEDDDDDDDDYVTNNNSLDIDDIDWSILPADILAQLQASDDDNEEDLDEDDDLYNADDNDDDNNGNSVTPSMHVTLPVDIMNTVLISSNANPDAENRQVLTEMFFEFVSSQGGHVTLTNDEIEELFTLYIDSGIANENIIEALETSELNPLSAHSTTFNE